MNKLQFLNKLITKQLKLRRNNYEKLSNRHESSI